MFKLEKEMREPVKAWLEDQGCTVRYEVYLPWGYCDMVGIELDEGKINLRRTARQFTRLSENQISYLLKMPRGGCYVEDLADIARRWYDSYGFKDMVKKLRKRRLLDAEERDGSLWLTPDIGWLPFHRKIIAVELKLNDAAGVLNQADNHRVFANETWAAMPEGRILRMRSDTRNRFEGAGVGLLSVTPDGCEVEIEPHQYEPEDVHGRIRAAFCAECVWQNFRTS